MISPIRSAMLSLGCLAVLTGMAAAQDGGFVDDSPSSSTASQSTASTDSSSSSAPSAPSAPAIPQMPARVGIALLPGIMVPKPGQPIPNSSITPSANAAVQALTPKLGLSSYEQSRIASDLTGTLSQANSMCSAHGDTPAASQDQLNSLYTSGLNQVENVLSDPQKQILQTMVSSNAAAATPPSSQFGLSADQKSQLQAIAQNQRALIQGVINNPSLSQAEKTAQIQAIRQETQTSINGVLTPEQQQQLQQAAQNRQAAAQSSNSGN